MSWTARSHVSNAHNVPQGVELAMAWAAPVEWPKDQRDLPGRGPSTRCGWRRDRPWAHRDPWGAGAPIVATADGSVSRAPWGVRVRVGLPDRAHTPERLHGSPSASTRKPRATAQSPSASSRWCASGPFQCSQPGQTWDGRVKSYLGPMEYDRLKALHVGLEKAIYFGGFPSPQSPACRRCPWSGLRCRSSG